MPLFIAALWGALIEIAGTLVGKVLVSLGIGYAVYSGVDTSITWAKSYLLSSLQGLPADAIGIASTLKVGVFISMVFSAGCTPSPSHVLHGDVITCPSP